MPPLGGARVHIGYIHKSNSLTVPLVQLSESQVNSSHESLGAGVAQWQFSDDAE